MWLIRVPISHSFAALLRCESSLGSCRGGEVSARPCGKFRRLLAGDLVGEGNRVARFRAQIRVRLEVGEHCRDALGAREPASEQLTWNSGEGELVSLTVQGGKDLVEAQEIADQRQVFAVPGEFRMRKRTDHDTAEFVDVTHVDGAALGIKR